MTCQSFWGSPSLQAVAGAKVAARAGPYRKCFHLGHLFPKSFFCPRLPHWNRSEETHQGTEGTGAGTAAAPAAASSAAAGGKLLEAGSAWRRASCFLSMRVVSGPMGIAWYNFMEFHSESQLFTRSPKKLTATHRLLRESLCNLAG